MSIADIVSKVDAAWIQVKSFPNTPRPYIELYNLVVSSLEQLSNRTDSGLIRKITTGDFGNKYHVEFKQGFLLNDLYLHLIPPPGQIISEGIFITSRRNKGPLMARQYEINSQTGSITYGNEFRWK